MKRDQERAAEDQRQHNKLVETVITATIEGLSRS